MIGLTHISELRSVSWHNLGSHLSTNTCERAPPKPQHDRPVLDLPTPEGWRAELISAVGCLRSMMLYNKRLHKKLYDTGGCEAYTASRRIEIVV